MEIDYPLKLLNVRKLPQGSIPKLELLDKKIKFWKFIAHNCIESNKKFLKQIKNYCSLFF